jgi:4-aminobutyrate aminotransferase-like enzyme
MMRADRVLVSREGPHHNVLKLKPPLAFGPTEAALVLSMVDRSLTQIFRS